MSMFPITCRSALLLNSNRCPFVEGRDWQTPPPALVPRHTVAALYCWSAHLAAKCAHAECVAASTNASVAEPVTVLHPHAGDPRSELVLPATLQAFSEAPNYARTSGYISHWYADIGHRVHAGYLLAKIEFPEANSGVCRWKNDTDLDFVSLNIDDVAMRALSFTLEVKGDPRRADAQVLNSNGL
jgi:hypothetical protein